LLIVGWRVILAKNEKRFHTCREKLDDIIKILSFHPKLEFYLSTNLNNASCDPRGFISAVGVRRVLFRAETQRTAEDAVFDSMSLVLDGKPMGMP
jgi:hypothetical protein